MPGEPGAAQDVRGPRRLAAIAASDRTLLSRSSLTLASRVAAKATQLLWLVLAARLLSVAEFAQYGYVVSVALTFCVLGDVGVGTVVAREIGSGRMRPSDAYWVAVPLVTSTGLLVAVAFVAFLAVGSGPGVTVASVGAGAAFVLANRAFDLNATSLRALGRIEFEAGLQLANAFLFVVLASGVAVAGGGVALVLAVLAAKELASAAVAAVAMREEVGAYVRVALRSTLPLLRPGLVVSLSSFGLAVCIRTPLVVLGNVGAPAQVAYFAAAGRFADTAVMLSVTAGAALMPGLAYVEATDAGRARRLIRRGVLVAGAAGVIVAVPLVLLRDTIARIAFGDSFAQAGPPLGILFAGLGLFAVTGVAWFALLALRRERIVLLGAWTGVATSVALALALISRHGTTGAAVSYVGGVGALALVLVLGLAWARRLQPRASRAASPHPAAR